MAFRKITNPIHRAPLVTTTTSPSPSNWVRTPRLQIVVGIEPSASSSSSKSLDSQGRDVLLLSKHTKPAISNALSQAEMS